LDVEAESFATVRSAERRIKNDARKETVLISFGKDY